MPVSDEARPLVVHVIYRLDVGGLENGVVNLINGMDEERYRHAVVSLTDVTDFRDRIQRADVECIALHKPDGHGVRIYPRLYSLFRDLRPAIVHTRNLAALEAQVPAWLAGVPVRIHGEHGRDMSDLAGASRKYRLIRRLFSPWVQRYVTVSRDLADYLVEGIHVAPDRVRHIYNGVDTQRFLPREAGTAPIPGTSAEQHVVLGWVGRMQPVKAPLILVELLHRLVSEKPDRRRWLRLALVGDGPLRDEVERRVDELQLRELVWLPGGRNDVEALLPAMDLFLLPSLGEGISNTILEAMACGLPVIATSVGGNPELVQPGRTGALVPPADLDALHAAVRPYLENPGMRARHGAAARQAAEQRFSLAAMVASYQQLYDQALAPARRSGGHRLGSRASTRGGTGVDR